MSGGNTQIARAPGGAMAQCEMDVPSGLLWHQRDVVSSAAQELFLSSF